jgi:hypothetical protein
LEVSFCRDSDPRQQRIVLPVMARTLSKLIVLFLPVSAIVWMVWQEIGDLLRLPIVTIITTHFLVLLRDTEIRFAYLCRGKDAPADARGTICNRRMPLLCSRTCNDHDVFDASFPKRRRLLADSRLSA